MRVVWTTPHGVDGTGGMDRLTQILMQEFSSGSKPVQFRILTTKGRHGKLFGAFVFLHAVLTLIARCALRQVDLLHLNTAARGSALRKMLLAHVAHHFGVPYAVHIHAGKFGPYWQDASPSLQRAIDAFLSRASVIIVLGREFEELIQRNLTQAAPRVRVLMNATPAREVQAFPSGRGHAVQLTSLGLLGARKNTTQLIAALARLKHRADWTATIAGDGEVAAARAQVEALGLSGRVDIPGWIGRPQVADLLARTDVFLLPSLSEGLPLAILEAFSYGVAVIASAVNAIPDVVHNDENGLLIPPGDLDALVAAITRLLDDDALRARLGAQAAKDYAAHYAIEPYVQRLLDIWAGAIAANESSAC